MTRRPLSKQGGGWSAVSRRLAQLYERSTPLERGALQAALRLADLGSDERLLDVATWTGALLRELAGRAPHPVQAIGIDRSAAMLSAARSRLPAAWLLVEADARALPFPHASFDVVMVCYLLHLLDTVDRVRVLREVRRVVRPRGRVVVVTVDARRRTSRTLLSALPGWTGLRRVELGAALDAAALHPVLSCHPRSGWPSLCLRAEPIP